MPAILIGSAPRFHSLIYGLNRVTADIYDNLGQVHPRRLGRPQLGTHTPPPFPPTSLTHLPSGPRRIHQAQYQPHLRPHRRRLRRRPHQHRPATHSARRQHPAAPLPSLGAPATDGLSYHFYTESLFPSFHEFHRAPVLPWKRIQYFGKFSMPHDKMPELRKLWPDWWLCPIRATNWSGLCDTFIRTAEVDPLRNEGEAYGMKLVAGGREGGV